MEAIFMLLFIGVIIAVVVVAVKNKQAQLLSWREFSKDNHLKLLDAGTWSNPRLIGRFRDLHVTLQIEVQGSGKHKKTYTRAIARFDAAMPRGLSITSEGFTDRLAKLVGGQDIQIGHAELDRQLRIRAEDEPGVLRLMSNWRARDAISALLTRDGKATVTQHQCTVLRPGFVSKPVELRAMLESVCRTVREVQRGLAEEGLEPTPEPRSLPAALAEAQVPAQFAWETDQVSDGVSAPDLLAELEGPGTVTQDGVETFLDSWSTTASSDDSPLLESVTGPPTVVSESPSVLFPPPLPPPYEADLPVPPQLSAPSAPPSTDASGSWVTLEEIVVLGDSKLSSAEKRAVAARLAGRRVSLVLAVERVSLTMGMNVPQSLEGGHTVIGSPVGHSVPRLAVRFPAHRASELSSLGYGDQLEVQGQFVSWDDFYRQVRVDAL